MLLFIGRSQRTKTRTQSSEHGVVATGKHFDLSSSLFVKRHIRLLRAPEAVKQHRQLAGYGNNGFALGLLATSSSQVEAPLAQRRVSSVRSKDMVGALDQQTSEVCVAGVSDAELRVMISGLTSTRS